MTRSGCGIFQPSVHCFGCGASLAFPAGAPIEAHSVIVSICCAVSEGSFSKCPNFGSANQGGIFFDRTIDTMAFAFARASGYVTKGIGAICPDLWQFWQ